MIRTIRIRGFKRFDEVEFRLPGHVVLAGPNNTGKTTVLQAIASWSLALQRWRELNDFNRRRGYTRAPIARQAFAAVPLRSFDLLWTDRNYRGQIEIELELSPGGSVGMEFRADSTEQIYVRPKATVPAETLRKLDLDAVFTRLLHKSWHVIVTRTPTFRVANASQNSPCSIRPCHDCRPIASVAYPHQR